MQNLQALTNFLPDLEKRGFAAGTWIGVGDTKGQTTGLPYVSLSVVVERFVEVAYQQGFVRSDFDWPAWRQTDEAEHLLTDPAAPARASRDQISRMLTVCIREDRFNEGALLQSFEAGLILAIVRRAAVLFAEEQRERQGGT